MAKRDLQEVVSTLRHDARQRALQVALRAPWPAIQDAAACYIDWLAIALWVRAISAVRVDIPRGVEATLEEVCPDFYRVTAAAWNEGDATVWRSMMDWVESHQFGAAKSEGWFEAVLFYAHSDPRTEQTWRHWDQTTESWQNSAPTRLPELADWQRQIAAEIREYQTLDRKRVNIPENVDVHPVEAAAAGIIEARARGLWAAFYCETDLPVPDAVAEEIRTLFPDGSLASDFDRWNRSLFFRVVRYAEAPWRMRARRENWLAALRHRVIFHPRYHRVVHFYRHCVEERAANGVRPDISRFADWLEAADRYHLSIRPIRGSIVNG